MARAYSICVTLMSATSLKNKRGSKALSPMVVFFMSPGSKRVLSRPAKHGGENPIWFQEYIIVCEERYYETATLTMILFHKGKNYDSILGLVGTIPVSKLTPGIQELQVLDESGRHDGGLLKFFVRVVPPPPPPQRSFKVTVHRAQGLKNVKWPWQRFSLSSLWFRKMKPYFVVVSSLPNEPLWVSPIAGKDGRDPVFNFQQTFICNESLIQQSKVSLKIELHHRHKAEFNRSSFHWNRAKDIMIGTSENIKVSEMEQIQTVDVLTPKGKHGGILYVSVELEELQEQVQELLTPSPSNTSWEPRLRRGHSEIKNLAELLLECSGPPAALFVAIVSAAL